MERSQPARAFIPASVILQGMRDEATADRVTFGWLIASLDKHSFGLILLLLAVAATAPGICVIAGLLLLIPAFQMIIGRPAPLFPAWIAARTVSTQRLGGALQRAIPVLKYLERSIHPRWRVPPEATKRIVGIAVMLLTLRLLLTPIPLSNVPPALLILIISLAYLEDDGLILAIGLLAGFIVLAIDLVLVWQAVLGAKRIGHFW